MRGRRFERILVPFMVDVLKPYFVDGTRTKHLRIRHLKGMLGAEGVVRHVRQAERSDTVPDLVVAPILVARDQRVVRRKLKIEALAHLSACVRIGKRAGELRDLKRGGIHNRRVHQDRKSTRLNSSHGYISYAVFCLTKNKIHGLPASI